MIFRFALATSLFVGMACSPGRPPQAHTPDPEPTPVVADPGHADPAVAGIPTVGQPDPKPLVVAGGPLTPPDVTSPALSIVAMPQFGAIPPAAGQLNVLVRLTGGDRPTEGRPPLDLALVIDRSGSMQGDKIRAVKEAAVGLLGHLSAEDRLTLITYSSDVTTVGRHVKMDAAGIAEAKKQILAIQADGYTALGPAMAEAFKNLRQRVITSDDRIAHVIFMSDGLANVGEDNPQVLGKWAAEASRDGISLSSLGVGLDYNEDLMTRIADQGGGRYHFIKDSDAIASVLGDEFKGLTATVASQVTLDLGPTDGVRLLRVFGYPTFEEGGRTMVRVGSVAANATREIILKLEYDRALGEAGAKALLANLRADFRNVLAEGAAAHVTASVSADILEDEGAINATENVEVSIRVSEVEAADQLQLAAKAVESGAFEQADSILKDNIADLRQKNAAKPSKRLEAQIQEMESAQGSLGAAAASPAARAEYVKGNKASSYNTMK